MTKTVLIAGGYGLVGGKAARQLRALAPDVEIILAGRNPEKGDALAAEIGNARTLKLDTANPGPTLDEAGPVDAVLAALQDPQDKLLREALERGIAHLSITRSVDEMATLVTQTAQVRPTAPVVPLAYWMAGLATVAALDLATGFERVDRIDVAALFDMADPIGPMTAEDFDSISTTAQVVAENEWRTVDTAEVAREHTIGGATFPTQPISILDVSGLRAATGAANIRFDLGMGESRGTRNGGAASHDMLIEIEGVRNDGGNAVRNRQVFDSRGQAHLTAIGAALAVRRVLGADGNEPPAAGLQLPETLLDPAATMAELASLGVEVVDDA